MWSWSEWINGAWTMLKQGSRVKVPSWLPHPMEAGFSPTYMAEPNGQCRDWALSLNDGSRIHIHEFCDGRRVAHRDATDPARGPIEAIFHWLFESTSGRITLGVGCTMLLASVFRGARR